MDHVKKTAVKALVCASLTVVAILAAVTIILGTETLAYHTLNNQPLAALLYLVFYLLSHRF